MSNTFLFELGLEEMPAASVPGALEQMAEQLQNQLSARRIGWKAVHTYATPRRLALLLEGLPERQPDQEEWILGPPESVAFEAGKPTRAATGFARKNKLEVTDLETIETERGLYLGYRQQIPGAAVPEVLLQILPGVIGSISWNKTMYWRESRFRFVRPLRWCVALWNRETVPFRFEGIAAGRRTPGHRFLGRGSVELAEAADYVDALRRAGVLVSVQERRDKIARELKTHLPSGLEVLPDARLMETVVYLNEWPTVICGDFDEKFLDLPSEVLVTVMRHHQKYFAVVDARGVLQPHFLTVANVRGDKGGKIREGHQRVLRARLDDAAFFWQADARKSLRERVRDLDQIVFQEQLGSYQAKAERLRRLCDSLDGDSDLQTAALLCKTDLTTGMVREFPELQGIVGGLYARREGYPEAVWKAIYEHYRPHSLEDDSPSEVSGARLSLADKIDNIVGCFSAGILPSGSRDPFALRRQAQGLIKVLFDHRLAHTLEELVEAAEKGFPGKLEPDRRAQLLEFLDRRLRHVLQEKGLPYDVINAVLAVPVEGVHDAFQRGEALAAIEGEEDFEALAMAFKRIQNILSEQPPEQARLSEDLLREPEERDLFRAYSELHPQVESLLRGREYLSAMKRIAGLRTAVDRFFDKVLVMTDEETLRDNRLCLLNQISELFLKIADISQVVREGAPSTLEMPA